MAKVTIESEEKCEILKVGEKFIPLETKKDKDGKWVSSKATINVQDDEVKTLKELGKKAGFKVK